MKPRTRVTLVAALLIAGFAAMIVGRMSNRPPKVEPSEFAQAVDLSPLAESAVHARGRLKSFHSFADMMVRAIADGTFNHQFNPSIVDRHSSIAVVIDRSCRHLTSWVRLHVSSGIATPRSFDKQRDFVLGCGV